MRSFFESGRSPPSEAQTSGTLAGTSAGGEQPCAFAQTAITGPHNSTSLSDYSSDASDLEFEIPDLRSCSASLSLAACSSDDDARAVSVSVWAGNSSLEASSLASSASWSRMF